MKASNYQELASRTINQEQIILSHREQMILNSCMGLAGESGELIDNIKKHIFHGHDIDNSYIKKELGDILWYVAALCTAFDLDMNNVMSANIEKLRKRYPDDFSNEKSINREV